jgi:hypothetical protein
MNARIRQLIAGVAAPAILLGAVSCGKVARTGRSPSFLVIDSLTAASGAKPSAFSGFLNSDVITLVKTTVNGVDTQVPTIYNDLGKVALHVLLKNPGDPAAPNSPSTLNAVTLSRYHVTFSRADGRNKEGIDVPFAFDGAITATITSSTSEVGFELVRHQAKEESPLRAMAYAGGRIEISTIAQITFYGRDLAGNEVSVTGSMTVDFSDFGDPT